VVEDEPLVALEVATALEEAGYVVVGPAGTVRQALDLLARAPCQCAVLDVNLGAETAEPIAAKLITLGVPFLTVSGYSRAQQPHVFSGAPFLAKPVNPRLLVAELARSLNTTGPHPQHDGRAPSP